MCQSDDVEDSSEEDDSNDASESAEPDLYEDDDEDGSWEEVSEGDDYEDDLAEIEDDEDFEDDEQTLLVEESARVHHKPAPWPLVVGELERLIGVEVGIFEERTSGPHHRAGKRQARTRGPKRSMPKPSHSRSRTLPSNYSSILFEHNAAGRAR